MKSYERDCNDHPGYRQNVVLINGGTDWVVYSRGSVCVRQRKKSAGTFISITKYGAGNGYACVKAAEVEPTNSCYISLSCARSEFEKFCDEHSVSEVKSQKGPVT